MNRLFVIISTFVFCVNCFAQDYIAVDETNGAWKLSSDGCLTYCGDTSASSLGKYAEQVKSLIITAEASSVSKGFFAACVNLKR